MKKVFIVLLIGISILLASGCGNKIEGAKNYPIEEFTFTSHEGKEFGTKDLEGKVWIADFVFTNCDDVCPPMTANMSKLQDMIKEEGLKDVEIVSFSVDPEVDDPQKLADFGKKFNVDFKNWTFLTGYSQEDIETFARENFKTIVKKPQEGDQVIHGTDFYLIDQDSKMVKTYSGFKEVPFEEIIKDIKTLQ